jgi:hypothetical protein
MIGGMQNKLAINLFSDLKSMKTICYVINTQRRRMSPSARFRVFDLAVGQCLTTVW